MDGVMTAAATLVRDWLIVLPVLLGLLGAGTLFGRHLAVSLTAGQNLNSSNFRQVYVTGTTLVTPQPYKISNTVSYTGSPFAKAWPMSRSMVFAAGLMSISSAVMPSAFISFQAFDFVPSDVPKPGIV